MRDDRRLVDYGSRISTSESQQTLENVLPELERAIELIEAALGEQPSPNLTHVPVTQARNLASAANALYNLHHWLPNVEGWCCGYHWTGNGRRFSCFSAHERKSDAELWIPYWRKEIRGRNRWVVEYRATSIGDFRKRGGPPKETQ